MIRMIPVVNEATGRVMQKPSNISTLDVPEDFDRQNRLASLDSHSRAHYLGTTGKTVSRTTVPRPLSWRVRGEECLVADHARPSSSDNSYTLVRVVEPGN
jgi:hypothetical protein